jgi:ABC-type uncharacterized transport system substrate-binding protein
MPIGSMRRTVVAATMAFVATLSLLAAGAAPAMAHPHVHISVRAILMVEAGAITGIHHIWLMDEAWLNSQLEEHDKDKDGRLSQAELSGVAEESRATLGMFRSFTTIRHGGQRIRPGAPGPVKIEYFGDLLGLSFTVPLARPISLAGAEMAVEIYDATFFSSFALAGPDAVSLGGDPSAACAIAPAPASAQQMAAYRLVARQLGEEFNKLAPLPQSVMVKCPTGGITPVVAR